MASRKVTSTEQTLSNGSLVSKEQLVTQRLQNQDKSLMPTTVFILMHVLDYELWMCAQEEQAQCILGTREQPWSHKVSKGNMQRRFPPGGCSSSAGQPSLIKPPSALLAADTH